MGFERTRAGIRNRVTSTLTMVNMGGSGTFTQLLLVKNAEKTQWTKLQAKLVFKKDPYPICFHGYWAAVPVRRDL